MFDLLKCKNANQKYESRDKYPGRLDVSEDAGVDLAEDLPLDVIHPHLHLLHSLVVQLGALPDDTFVR